MYTILNFYIRVAKLRLGVLLCPAYSHSKGKFGKFYASRDKVIVENLGLMVPKASPLKARLYIPSIYTIFLKVIVSARLQYGHFLLDGYWNSSEDGK